MIPEITKYIEELRHTVTVAGLNYEIWWVFKSKDTRPEFLDTMNDYPLFFQTSIHAHFVSLLVALYRLYETRRDTYNIPTLLRLIKNQKEIEDETLKDIAAIYDNAKPLWQKVSILRNKAFGHRSKAHTVEEVFGEAGVSSDDLRDLVGVSKELLNKISRAWDRSAHAFNLGSREDTLALLKDLKRLKKSL